MVLPPRGQVARFSIMQSMMQSKRTLSLRLVPAALIDGSKIAIDIYHKGTDIYYTIS